MKDYIVRATAGDGSVLAFAAYTKNTVAEAAKIHHTAPIATAALGRLLTGAAMMGRTLKNGGDLITISMRGDGPLGGIVATTDNLSRVRGYVHNPDVETVYKENGKLDVGGALGNGTMSVIKDLGLKEPMVGQIPLVSGEVADDLTYYYAKSEQIPSAVALGVLVDRDLSVKQAGGFFIQMMPGAKEDTIAVIEKKLPYLSPVTTMLEEKMAPEDMLHEILGECGLVIHETSPAAYYCNCSREKVARALLSVGKRELQDMLREDGHADMHCHFCGKDYHFTGNDLEALIEGIKNG